MKDNTSLTAGGSTVHVRPTSTLIGDIGYITEQLGMICGDLQDVSADLIGPSRPTPEDSPPDAPLDVGLVGRLQDRMNASKSLIQEIQDIVGDLKQM